MTREEALEKIKFLSDNACSYYLGRENAIALNVAIEALEQIKAIEGIIDVSNITIQEDVLKYKMIVDVVKGG